MEDKSHKIYKIYKKNNIIKFKLINNLIIIFLSLFLINKLKRFYNN